MRRLKEAYGESKELDNFVELAQEDFRTYYKVEARRKNGTPKTQERYFYNEESAREYYEKFLEDIVDDYRWEDAEIFLYEVNVKLNQEELESKMIYEEDEEEYIENGEEEIIEDEE